MERSTKAAGGSTTGGVGEDADRAAPEVSGTTGEAGDAEPPTVSGGVGLTVHVTGEVRRPGVYAMPDGSRIVDAVKRAGGATKDANPHGVNQAAELRDGQQVVVPDRQALKGGAAGGAGSGGGAGAGGASGAAATGSGGAGAGTAGAGAPGPPVDLNTATPEQLDQLDGVGPTTAEKIIRLREERGGIGTVEDLAEIPGIGPKKLEALRSQLER